MGSECTCNVRAVLVSVVGMKRQYLDTWSITTRIAVKPLDVGTCSTKSILIECHGRPETGKSLQRAVRTMARGFVASAQNAL